MIYTFDYTICKDPIHTNSQPTRCTNVRNNKNPHTHIYTHKLNLFLSFLFFFSSGLSNCAFLLPTLFKCQSHTTHKHTLHPHLCSAAFLQRKRNKVSSKHAFLYETCFIDLNNPDTVTGRIAQVKSTWGSCLIAPRCFLSISIYLWYITTTTKGVSSSSNPLPLRTLQSSLLARLRNPPLPPPHPVHRAVCLHAVALAAPAL